MHESKMHYENMFLTLTFEDKHIPSDGSVHLRDLQLFIKDLRYSLKNKRIRFFGCGEYGDLNNRPHYHVLIFGHCFDDLKKWKETPHYQIYTSEKLNKLWPYGHNTVGKVNFKTANYCAQYAMKKFSGDLADDHYTRPHCVTGNLVRLNPEFVTMSKKPGLGYTWLQKFKSDCYPSDFLMVDGRKRPIPKYYDTKLKLEAERELELLKRKRVLSSHKHRADQTPARLAVREEKLRLDQSMKKRNVGAPQ